MSPRWRADPLPDEADKLPGRVEGRVTFEHVRFGYSPRQAAYARRVVYRRAGSEDRRGGNHGRSKTTLINLLMRFYEIDGGRITLDGVDTRLMNRGELRQQFGMVLRGRLAI